MIYQSLVQYVLQKFLTGICVLLSVTGIRYAPCVSYITKLTVIFLTNINIKSPCAIRATTILKVPQETFFGCFSKNTLTHS